VSKQSDIAIAIFDHLAAGGLSIPIAWPGVDNESTLPYLAVSHLPAPTIAASVNDCNFYTGFTQFTVVFSVGYGIILAMEKADEVISLFPRGLSLQNGSTLVEFNKLGYQVPPLQSDNSLSIPVTVEYNVYGD
jgi:hypothetical protein